MVFITICHSPFSESFFIISIMSLLIKYASRNRPKLLLETLENIHSTISGEDYQILITIDKDDSATLAPEILEKAYQYSNVKVIVIEPVSKVFAINYGFEYAKPWTWCVTMSDDFKFVQKDWNLKMLELIQGEWDASLDFFAHFNDNFVGDKLPTMAIMGRDYYNRFGYIYSPQYFSVSADSEQWHVSRMLGRHKYFPDVFFHHLHPGNIPNMPTDETYRKNNPLGEIDTQTYFDRMSHGFYIENPVYMPEEVKYYMDKRLANEQR